MATTEFAAALAAAWRATSALELAGVATGFVYLLLAIRERAACWLAGAVSTAIYLVVFIDARVYLQAGLQGVYLALSAYGFLAWRRGAGEGSPSLRRAPAALQLGLLAAVGAATGVAAPLLTTFTDAASPWLDASTTAASLAATWLLARKYVDSWLWWIVIDAAIGLLAIDGGLWATALLYLGFAALAAVGFRRWRQRALAA